MLISPRVGNLRQKNNSAEDGIDGTKGYFRRNSVCSADQKILGIPFEPCLGRENNSEFRSVEQNQKQTLGIPLRSQEEQAGCTPSQALEKRRNEKEAHGEIETQHLGYLGYILDQIPIAIIKGSLTRDFRLQVFFMNQCPPGLQVFYWSHFEFFRKLTEIFVN